MTDAITPAKPTNVFSFYAEYPSIPEHEGEILLAGSTRQASRDYGRGKHYYDGTFRVDYSVLWVKPDGSFVLRDYAEMEPLTRVAVDRYDPNKLEIKGERSIATLNEGLAALRAISQAHADRANVANRSKTDAGIWDKMKGLLPGIFGRSTGDQNDNDYVASPAFHLGRPVEPVVPAGMKVAPFVMVYPK